MPHRPVRRCTIKIFRCISDNEINIKVLINVDDKTKKEFYDKNNN